MGEVCNEFVAVSCRFSTLKDILRGILYMQFAEWISIRFCSFFGDGIEPFTAKRTNLVVFDEIFVYKY